MVHQSKYIVMITKEMFTIIVNFVTPGEGVFVLGQGHIIHKSAYTLFSTLSMHSTLIAIALGNYYASFQCHLWNAITAL